jgi:hypothetical protein
MEAEVYKTLLKQAEDELGATPGAYCSHKAALRALELLRAAGQQEFSEVDGRITKHRKTIDQYANRCAEQARVIERQAQAIQRLEAEKLLDGRLGQARKPSMDEGILKQMERMTNKSYYDPGLLSQQVFRETLNRKLDQGKPWTEY